MPVLPSPPFTRLTVADPATNRVVQDIYDKLQAAERQTAQAIAAIPAAPPASGIATSISGASGVAGVPQLAFLPALPTLPNPNPSQDPVHDQDGELIEFTPSPTLAGTLYRYDLKATAWVGPLLGGVLLDTHSNRVANYSPATYLGALFFETDRTSLYQAQVISGGPAWVWITGCYVDIWANRPTDLSPADVGFIFRASDREITERLQSYFGGAEKWEYLYGIQQDVFANRPLGATLTPTEAGYLFYSTDYNVLEQWNGTHWAYFSGTTTGAHSLLATLAGILSATEAGWLFTDTTYAHLLRWSGTAWAFADGEASQFFVMAPTTPQGGVWHPCDGGTYTCENADGTTASVTTPNLNGTLAAIFGNGYSATPVAATAPSLSTNVGVSIGNFSSLCGDDSDFPPGVLVTPSGSTAVAAAPHTHPITTLGSGVPVTVTQPAINPPTLANGGLPAYFTTSWFLRA